MSPLIEQHNNLLIYIKNEFKYRKTPHLYLLMKFTLNLILIILLLHGIYNDFLLKIKTLENLMQVKLNVRNNFIFFIDGMPF